MNTSKMIAAALVLFIALSLPSAINAQDGSSDLEELKKLAPKVYLD